MTLRLLALLAVLLGLGWTVPAHACSPVGESFRPTNFELVQLADAIVVAKAEAADGERGVSFHVEQAVKGAPPQRVTLSWTRIETPEPSNLTNLSHASPGDGASCGRVQFARGELYLLFLARAANGEWHQLGHPFSRISEDYRGEDTIWMRTVRRYVALQQRLAPMAQIEALSAMRTSGRTRDGNSLAPSELTDIADHLSSVSPWKPTAWLLRAYARAEQAEGAGNADVLVELALAAPPRPDGPPGREGVRLAILSSLAAGDHPGAMPLVERLAAATATPAPARGQILRYLAGNGRLPQAYQWIETQLMAQLPRLDQRDAMRLLADVAQAMHGDGGDESQARWRNDPHAAATWPELSLSLYWYQVRTFGEDNAISFTAVDAIPITNYRARPLLTLRRGMTFDEGVTAWAVAELARPLPPADDDVDDETRVAADLLPLRVLVSAWSEDRTAVLTRLFCQGDLRRRLVILAIGRWGDPLYEELLGRMANAPGLDADDRAALLRAAVQLTARDLDDRRALDLMGGEEEGWLLTRLARGAGPAQPGPALCPA